MRSKLILLAALYTILFYECLASSDIRYCWCRPGDCDDDHAYTFCWFCWVCGFHPYDARNTSPPDGRKSVPYNASILKTLHYTESKFRHGNLTDESVIDFFLNMKHTFNDHMDKCTTCDLRGPEAMTGRAHKALSYLSQQNHKKFKKIALTYFKKTKVELEELDENIVGFALKEQNNVEKEISGSQGDGWLIAMMKKVGNYIWIKIKMPE